MGRGSSPQAPRRRLAAEAAQAAEPVEVLLWLALVPWPVWWLVLWRVLRSGLWRVLLWLVLWLVLLRLPHLLLGVFSHSAALSFC